MKRKPLSLKRLHQYVADYIVEQNIALKTKESKEVADYYKNIIDGEGIKVLKNFLEYIWKNPR